METIVIVGLIIVVALLANKKPPVTAVATSQQVQPPRTITVDVNPPSIAPHIAPPTQVDVPLPLTVLQQQPAPGALQFQPGVIIPSGLSSGNDLPQPFPGNPDIGTFGGGSPVLSPYNFGPAQIVPDETLPVQVQTAPKFFGATQVVSPVPLTGHGPVVASDQVWTGTQSNTRFTYADGTQDLVPDTMIFS